MSANKSLNSILDGYLDAVGINTFMKASSVVSLAAKDIPTYEMGFFSQEGEEFYVLFDPLNGDMEFSSAEALGKYINSKEFKVGSFEWVTDNDPIELDYIQWYETDAGKIIGNHVIIPPTPNPFAQKFDYSNILKLI